MAIRGARTGILVLAGILVVSTAVLLAPADDTRSGALGLPVATWWMLAGLGGMPLLLVVSIYVATFRDEAR